MVIGGRLSKYWKNSWLLVALRLTKSGIEYVILAGSSIFESSVAKSRFLLVMVVFVARAARDFFKKLDFWHLESEKFAGPQGPVLRQLSRYCGQPQELSKYWKISWD